MSVLGQPYRIMYLAKGQRSGLTDVQAAVLRPDNSVAGIYPLFEAPGPLFKGCYYYDYLSSPDDREGEYFSKVVSPTEGRMDIVRFSLYKEAVSADDRRLVPVSITGTIQRTQISGQVQEEGEMWARVDLKEFCATISQDIKLKGVLSDTEADGRVTLNPQIE